MALSRDSRMDRRRRVLLSASAQQTESTTHRKSSSAAAGEDGIKKNAGYSQDVRQACGTRLVQLIPVRRRSFIALVFLSIFITGSLLLTHYLVYVSGDLLWYGHPLSIAVDLTHPQSIAAWLSSHLWLLCLGTTVLTFQLRRHKLDDYAGEYRLWFWMVVTCLLASIDSTTHLSELFGLGLDKWTQENIGWSGKAVVLATMATLVGMLGLRLCSELKSVPFSLICWLIGLVAWAGNAALSQDKFLPEMEPQPRLWLRSSLWLGGLTSIWIAAVAYLRHVYMEAQRRFLARGRLARRTAGIPLGERMRQSIPFIHPKLAQSDRDGDAELAESEASRWSLRRIFRRRPKSVEPATPTATRRPKSVPPAVSAAPLPLAQPKLGQQQAPALRNQTTTAPSSDAAPLSAANRQSLTNNTINKSSQSTLDAAGSRTAATNTSLPSNEANDELDTRASRKLRWPFVFKLWPGKDIPEEEALEYRKIKDEERDRLATERKQQREAAAKEKAIAKQTRQAEREAAKQAKRNSRGAAKPNKERTGGGIGKKLLAPVTAARSIMANIKLPSLAAFKLSPPEGEGNAPEPASGKSTSLKPVVQDKAIPSTGRPGSGQLPGTNLQGRNNSPSNDYEDDDADDDRQLSKADRKKFRRQNRAA